VPKVGWSEAGEFSGGVAHCCKKSRKRCSLVELAGIEVIVPPVGYASSLTLVAVKCEGLEWKLSELIQQLVLMFSGNDPRTVVGSRRRREYRLEQIGSGG